MTYLRKILFQIIGAAVVKNWQWGALAKITYLSFAADLMIGATVVMYNSNQKSQLRQFLDKNAPRNKSYICKFSRKNWASFTSLNHRLKTYF
mmetsp:Transcript_8265/g.12714  ORF Transcript_8265/g.12714 Transcript_8265/m.12714 type:complete len:92 (-) Transcript_8265:1412-1687(-)